MPVLGAVSSGTGRTKNVMDFGANPTPGFDNYPAFMAALDALPKYGGSVVVPAGDTPLVFDLSQEIALGDGTTSAASTRHGMRLVGEAPGAFPAMAGGGAMNVAPITLRRTGSSGGAVVRVAGPLSGWGLDDLTLDGGAVSGVTGLRVVAGQYGDVEGLAVLRCLTGLALTSVPNFGGITCNTMHNVFDRVGVVIPSVDQATGIGHLGAGGVTSNSCYNKLREVSLVPAGQGLAGTIFGILFGSCDTDTYEGVHMPGTFSSAATNAYGVTFNYANGQNTNWPFDCQIDNIDFGRTDAKAVINNGSPTGGATNRISGIVRNNQAPANPALAGLLWGYSAST
ncbi:MAG: hypothetical protein JWO69_1997 [Thermoleophilia bacterium]|nr:hypothetical protein [Thermoleophilia bacterium]